MAAWRYLEGGGKRAFLVCHRRWGKDDLALHRTACAAFERVGTYWHMLPEASQARKAIWEAVNPKTGRRRIDEAFPKQLRDTTRDQEMFVRFANGSSWQLVGSDNYDSLVGAPPVGVVFSEWALAKPQAWAYIRPILVENDGWALFITSSRGKNHAHTMYRGAKDDPTWYTELSPASATGVFTPEQLAQEKLEYLRDFKGSGQATFEQEYNCSFDGAVLGAIYADELAAARNDGRIALAPYDRALLVHTYWDIGIGDSTAIWCAQFAGREIRLIDYYEASGKDAAHYVGWLGQRGYAYGTDWLPHDAQARELGTGKSIEEVLRGMGRQVRITPMLKLEQGINAARLIFSRCWFDERKCEQGLEALLNYRRALNSSTDEYGAPVHDWASHGADAFRYLAVAEQASQVRKLEPIRYDLRGIK